MHDARPSRTGSLGHSVSTGRGWLRGPDRAAESARISAPGFQRQDFTGYVWLHTIHPAHVQHVQSITESPRTASCNKTTEGLCAACSYLCVWRKRPCPVHECALVRLATRSAPQVPGSCRMISVPGNQLYGSGVRGEKAEEGMKTRKAGEQRKTKGTMGGNTPSTHERTHKPLLKSVSRGAHPGVVSPALQCLLRAPAHSSLLMPLTYKSFSVEWLVDCTVLRVRA